MQVARLTPQSSSVETSPLQETTTVSTLYSTCNKHTIKQAYAKQQLFSWNGQLWSVWDLLSVNNRALVLKQGHLAGTEPRAIGMIREAAWRKHYPLCKNNYHANCIFLSDDRKQRVVLRTASTKLVRSCLKLITHMHTHTYIFIMRTCTQDLYTTHVRHLLWNALKSLSLCFVVKL